MADEAFALSPISARAALPSEADYDAIRDAFMETSRGRWFLGEYAKRNRNADTSMVLDAVARIEEALAAQRQPPPPEDKLPEALQAIRNAVDEAALLASSALAGLALEDNLAPVRKGARIIKEISWRWREIGADSRICDLIDSQLSAIEASCGQISEIDPRPEVGAAFDLIRDRIDGFDEADGQGAVDQHVSSPAAAEEAAVAAPVAVEASAVQKVPVAVDVMPDAPAQAAELEASEPATIAPERIEADEPVEAPAIDADAEAETAADSAEADDDAILDMVAIEMAAPDETSDDDYFSAINDAVSTAGPGLAETEAVEIPAPVEIRQPTPAPRQPQPVQASFQPPAAAAAPVVQPSLGSTLLASGFLEQQRAPANDPLTPIRRMSQAERIAFFS